MKKEFLQSLKVIALGMVLAFGMNYAMAAWSGPTAQPPGSNTSAPINISQNNQAKTGGTLSLGRTSPLPTTPSWSSDELGWQVWGYGTDAPKLDINGVANIIKALNIKSYLYVGRGSLLKGASIFTPAGTDSSDDGQILMVLDHNQDTGSPVLSVDTADRRLSMTNGSMDAGRLYADIIDGQVVRATDLNAYRTVNSNNAIVGDVFNTIKDNTPDQNLYLIGTTNIGSGDECYISKNLMDSDGCPEGTYLYRIDSSSTSSYGWCKAFNTVGDYADKVNSSTLGKCLFNENPELRVVFDYAKLSYYDKNNKPSEYKYSCKVKIEAAISYSGGTGNKKVSNWKYKLSRNDGDFYNYQTSCGTSTSCTIELGSIYSGPGSTNFTRSVRPIISVTMTDDLNGPKTATFDLGRHTAFEGCR